MTIIFHFQTNFNSYQLVSTMYKVPVWLYKLKYFLIIHIYLILKSFIHKIICFDKNGVLYYIMYNNYVKLYVVMMTRIIDFFS